MAVPRATSRSRALAVALAATFALTVIAPVAAVAPVYEPCDVQNATASHPGTAGQNPSNDLDCYAVAIQQPDNAPAPTVDYTPASPWAVRPLLSVGDIVPRTRNNAQEYQMVGLPDGLGITSLKDERRGPGRNFDHDENGNKKGAVIYMNHEIGVAPFPGPQGNGPLILSQAVIGEAQNEGAFVSRWVLDEDGRVVSGDYAYDTVYYEDQLRGPIARTDNATRAFARFCSATLAGREYGFDRTIFFTNEEDGFAGNTFDLLGGSSVAIFDQEAHSLPALGHFAKENTVPAPNTGNKTVLFLLEDGPASPDSQLYMWVGTRERRGSVLARNGLLTGTLYVFASNDPARNSEVTFQAGSVNGRWVSLPDQRLVEQTLLEGQSDTAGAFGFVRLEDGAFDINDPNRFFFATTGDISQSYNTVGRIYEMAFNPQDPTAPTTLTIRQNAQAEILAGKDTALTPDNLDVANGVLMVNEDGTGGSRPMMASKNRDGSIWRFNISNFEDRSRIVELDPPSEDGVAVGPGVWETSGITFADGVGFGEDSWIFDVQAHPPTTPPGGPAPAGVPVQPGVAPTVEDGQLLVLYRPEEDDDDDDDD